MKYSCADFVTSIAALRGQGAVKGQFEFKELIANCKDPAQVEKDARDCACSIKVNPDWPKKINDKSCPDQCFVPVCQQIYGLLPKDVITCPV